MTQAWVRLRKPPTFRAATSVQFKDFFSAVDAVRAISQANLYPANCRLLDPLEAFINGSGDGKHAVLVLTFESADHPLEEWLKRALELCADYGGEYETESVQQKDAHRSGAAGQWRERFAAKGLGGLQDAPRSGRPRSFSPRRTGRRRRAGHQ